LKKSKDNYRSNFLLESLKLPNTSLFNLGDVILSEGESIVLGLGLKYLPKTQCLTQSIKDSLINSVDSFIKRIQTNIFFKDQKYNLSDIPKLLKPNNTEFQTPINDYLQAYKLNINKKIINYNWSNKLTQLDYLIKNNLTALANKKTIIIKPADKNLGTCIITLDIYKSMCYKILHDVKTYVKIENFDKSCKTSFQALEGIMKKYNKHNYCKRDFRGNQIVYETQLHKSLFQLSNSTDLKIPYFYALPKMHKVTVDKPFPAGRPIVSSINSCTYFTSKYLHNYLKKLTMKLCSICRSSLEVLAITSKLKLPFESYILCADVTSLYPSIPIDFGLKAVKYVLHCYNMPEIEFHLELLNWVLTNNYFTFNDEYFHQIYGTAMGTPVAVEYANTVMFYIEHTIIDKYEPILYLRYIDDIFAILPTVDICKKFIGEINNQCSNIQLESVTIGKTGIFLDLNLEIKNENIISKVYQKPSNKYLYLPPTTNHPSSVMLNVIKQELRRYCLYTTNQSDEFGIKKDFYERLRLRGHMKTYLDPLFQPTLERNSLLIELQRSVKGKTRVI